MGNDVIQGGPVQKKFHLYSVDFPPFEISEFFIQLDTLLMYRVAVPLLLFISLLLSPPRLARWYLLLLHRRTPFLFPYNTDEGEFGFMNFQCEKGERKRSGAATIGKSTVYSTTQKAGC